MRRVILALVAAGLAAVVWLLWPDAAEDETPEPEAAVSTTTTSTEPAPTTTVEETTTTTGPETHVVETVEEAEEILRQLWFGWFEGIYNQDEERIREVVATNQFLDAGVDAIGSLDFIEEPTEAGLSLIELEILEANEQCLAVWTLSEPEFLEITDPRSGVDVLRWVDESWKFASAWQLRGDLWEADCEAALQPLR